MTDRTMQKWWRRAVLAANKNRCAVCGKVRQDSGLECHHLIKRRYRITRHDWRNGVPVCCGECHSYADTTAGTAEILANHPYATGLIDLVRQYRNVKNYLAARGLFLSEFDAETLAELKQIAKEW